MDHVKPPDAPGKAMDPAQISNPISQPTSQMTPKEDFFSETASHSQDSAGSLVQFIQGGIIQEVLFDKDSVLKGIAWISSLKVSCKSLSEANIGFTLNGGIKIILDLQHLERDHLHQSPKTSQVLLDFPILAELIEDMMLSRYHLTSKWSEDALDFLSCTLTGSLETLMQHNFLSLAVSPRRLIPRIRFAFEMSRGCLPLHSSSSVEVNDTAGETKIVHSGHEST
ncbi:hypothetical protein WAI453_013575 [Rhynchosporium graminicola]